MTFVTTSLAVAGLAAVAIPILIHLLSRQRRRPVEWAAMRFLLEAFRKQRRRLRVQQWLLLAARCLIVLLLGAALARPLLHSAGILDAGGGRVVYLIIDNGLASGLTPAGGESALQEQVRSAQAIVDALEPGDRVGVITAARPVRSVVAPPTSDHGAVMQLLRELTPEDSPTDLVGALGSLRQILLDEQVDAGAQQFAYLLSEFRSGSAPLDAPLPAMLRELGEEVTLVAAPAAEESVGNIAITSIDPVRNVIIPGAADGSGQVSVRLARSGGLLEADVTRVRLAGDGLAPVEPRIVQWEPGQSTASVDFLLNLAGQSNQELALTAMVDDDVLSGDNRRHGVLSLRERIGVVMLQRRTFGFEARLDRLNAGQWMYRALGPREDGALRISEVEPAALRASDLRAADVVFTSRPDLLSDEGWATLRAYVDRGGLLVVTPPGQMNVHQWVEGFTSAMDLPWRIGPETQVVEQGMFLASEQPRSELLRLLAADLDELVRPVVNTRVLPVEVGDSAAATELLVLESGGPMVVAATPEGAPDAEGVVEGERLAAGGGLVVFFTVAPELSWTNLPSKPLMVPLMHELVRQGLSSIRGSERIVAGDRPVLASHASAAELVSPEGERISVNAARPQQPLMDAGLYAMQDAAGQAVGMLAVNVDAASSRSDAQSASAVTSWLSGSGREWGVFLSDDPAAELRSAAASSSLAGLLLAVLLGLVLLETLLARRFSYSFESGGAAAAGGLKPTIHQHGPGAVPVIDPGGGAA